MGHDHDHHHSRAEYYLEQLFTIGICGAFGIVAISLYWTNKLNFMVVARFHPWVLAGGIMLLVMVAIRAFVVWQSVEEPVAVPVHDHDPSDHGHCDHEHHHDHDHVDGHDHDHLHHDHDHTHGHGHDHAHDHGHDHGWAPWRYVVLMLPVVLFLLNLPNDGFSVEKMDLKGIAMDKKVQSRGVLQNVGFQQLERAALDPNQRDLFEGKQISLIGRFAGDEPKRFSLTRYKMNCCAADAVPLNAIILIDPDPKVPGIDPKAKQNKWVKVTGLVAFINRPGTGEFVTSIVIQPKEGETLDDYIEEIPTPGNQFLN